MQVNPLAQLAVQASVISQLEAQIEELNKQLQKAKSENAYYIATNQYLLQENMMLRNRQRSIPSQANQQQQRSVQKPQNQQAATSPTQTDFPASIRSNLFASSQKNAQRPVYTPAQVQHIKNFIQVNQIRPQNTAKNLNQRQDTAETLNKTDRNYNQAQRNQMQPQKEANSNANNYLTRLTNYRDTRSSMHGDNAQSETANAAQIDRGSQLEPKIVDPLPKSAPLVVQTQSSVSGVKYNNIDELGNATGPKMSLEHSSGQPPQALSSVQRPPSPVLNNSLPLLASAVGKSVSSHVNEPGTDNLGNSPDFPISISSPDISVALPSSPKSSDQLGTKQTGDTSSATMWPLNLFNGFFSSPKPARSLNVSTIMEVEDTPRPKVIDAPNSETLASKRSTSEITAKEGSPTTKKILSGKLKSLAVSARSSNSPSSAQPATTTSVDSAAPTANSENSPNQDPLKTIKNAVDSRSTFDLRVPSGLIGRVDTSLPSDLQLTSDQRLASDSRVYANASLPLTESNPKFPVTGKIPKKSAMKPTKGVLISDDEDQILHDDDFLSDVDKFLQKSPISTPVKPVSTYISSKIAESPSTAFANSAKSTSGNSPNTAPLVIRKPVPHPINLLPIKTAATLPPFSASPQASSEPMKATKNTPAVLELSPLAAGSSAKSINETPILTFVAGPPQPAAENNTTIKTINPTPKKTKLRLVEASSSDDSLSDETPESKPIVEKATKFNMLKRPGSDLNASPKSQKLINQTDAKIEILSEVTTPLSSEPVISFETILSEQTEKNNLLRLASRTSSKSYQNLMKADKSKDIPKFYAKANSPTPPPVVVHSSQIDDSNLPFNAETTGIIKLPIKSAWCKKSQNSEFQTVDVTRDASIKFVYRKGVDISFRSNPIKNDDLNYIQLGNNGLELLFIISLKTGEDIFVHADATVEKEFVSRAIDPFYLNSMPKSTQLLFKKFSRKTDTSTPSTAGVGSSSKSPKKISFKVSVTKSWLLTPTLPISPVLVIDEMIFTAKGVILGLRSPDLLPYSQIQRLEYSVIEDVALLIVYLAEGEQVWIKATGWSPGILDIVKSNVFNMKDEMLVQFHKNDTGKFPPATTYDNLKRISDNTGKMLRKSGKASRENSNITPFVSSSSSTTSDLIPWLIVAKENVRGTFNMRKAEKNFFRGLVREYLFLRFKNINKYMISDPSGKKDYGIPRDRVGDFLGWYGEKAAEKQNKDQREMLQTLHRGEKLRNLEKRI